MSHPAAWRWSAGMAATSRRSRTRLAGWVRTSSPSTGRGTAAHGRGAPAGGRSGPFPLVSGAPSVLDAGACSRSLGSPGNASGRWLVMTAVCPAAAATTSAQTRSAVAASRWAVGSSSTSTGRSASTARASPMRWRSPPDTSLPCRPTRVSSPRGSYSRFVGDVFGAPLAMEGLAAFFLESTFLALWIFGWNRLSPRVHLATIWAAAAGGVLSAAFIMAANSWMQHPVGYTINSAGHAQLTSIGAVLTNPVFLRSFLHVLLASLITACVVMLGISAWHLRRGSHSPAFDRSARIALAILVAATMLNLLVGSELGVTEGTFQPMKIAAAEAQWETCQPCSFSLFQIGGGSNDQTPTKIIEVPYLLSLLATNH